ncbi:hypothetical protein OIU78_018107 [Salix suchowensis]|nr:hypothetical protein OIU78_018107 [Salix suchowensis]
MIKAFNLLTPHPSITANHKLHTYRLHKTKAPQEQENMETNGCDRRVEACINTSHFTWWLCLYFEQRIEGCAIESLSKASDHKHDDIP